MRFKKTILKNGLRIITVPMKDNPTVMVLVLVNTGAEYETKEINGISHFLEHMCFKGTTRRPDAKAISSELDGLGAENNAFTDRELTGYYAKGDARHFKQLADIVADIFLNSIFPAADIEKEKGVIKGEIDMYADLPQHVVADNFLSLLYGRGPGGWPILGKKEIISSFGQKTFRHYHEKFYAAQNTIVVVAGGVNEKESIKEITKHFNNLKSGKKFGKEKLEKKQTKPAFTATIKKTDQTHLVLGARSFGLLAKEKPILDVLTAVLGKGMSSRLFLKLRDEMGLGYYVSADHWYLTDRGALTVRAGVHNERVSEAIRAILEEIQRLKKELVSGKELKKTKEFLIGHLKLGLETSDEIAEFYGFQEVLRKPIEMPKEIIDKINKVSAKEIKNLANKIFVNNRLNLSLVGPSQPNIAKIFHL